MKSLWADLAGVALNRTMSTLEACVRATSRVEAPTSAPGGNFKWENLYR
jgi:hypothetical protein